MNEFTEKMDMLDLIITALKDHEKRLDDLITRLEAHSEEEAKALKEYEKYDV